MQSTSHPIENKLKMILNGKSSATLADDLFLALAEIYNLDVMMLNEKNPEKIAVVRAVQGYANFLMKQVEENVLANPTAKSLKYWIDVADHLRLKGDFQTASVIQDQLDMLAHKKNADLKKAFAKLDSNTKEKLQLLNVEATGRKLTRLSSYKDKVVTFPIVVVFSAFDENNAGRKGILEGRDQRVQDTANVNITTQTNNMEMFARKAKIAVNTQKEAILIARVTTVLENLHANSHKHAQQTNPVSALKNKIANKIISISESADPYKEKATKLKKLLTEQAQKIELHVTNQVQKIEQQVLPEIRKATDTTVIKLGKQLEGLFTELAELKRIKINPYKFFNKPVSPNKVDTFHLAWEKISQKMNYFSAQNPTAEIQDILQPIKNACELIATNKNSIVVTNALQHLSDLITQLPGNPIYSSLQNQLGEDLRDFAALGAARAAELNQLNQQEIRFSAPK